MNEREYLTLVDEVIACGKYKPDWRSLAEHRTPEWFRRAKFGMFVTWGVFTVPEYSYEWYPRHMYREGSPENEHFKRTYGDLKHVGYKDLVGLFTAPKFDAKQWLDLFEEAGVRYLVPVAEHHDGFQIYDSDLSEWNCVRKGPHRDILGELRAEAERRGIVFCASSHRAEHYWFLNEGREFDSDVNDPANDALYGPAVLTEGLKGWFPKDLYSVGIDSPRMREHCENWLARTCELVEKYRPRMVYFDWWINNHAFKPYLKKFAAYYYDRAEEWGIEVAIDYKHDAFALGTAVFDLERGQMAGISPRSWQADTSLTENSWSYAPDSRWKRASDILCTLVDTVSKNGCLLLNVGPRADGSICEEERALLKEIGAWMRVNGEAVYDTTYWKTYGEGPTKIREGQFSDADGKVFTEKDIRFTYRGGTIYAFVMRMNGTDVIRVRSLGYHGVPDENEVLLDAQVLGYPDVKVTMRRTRAYLELRLSEKIASEKPVCVKISID